ncbi:MAG: hypothetical protein RJB36_534, partial [Bacteroidota bacterium]
MSKEKIIKSKEHFVSDISRETFPYSQKVEASSISDNLIKFIQTKHADFSDNSCLSISELSAFRVDFISFKLKGQMGELSALEKTVLDTFSNGNQISNLTIQKDDSELTTGQKMADHVASFGGSWTFIISFGIFLVIWISINTTILM